MRCCYFYCIQTETKQNIDFKIEMKTKAGILQDRAKDSDKQTARDSQNNVQGKIQKSEAIEEVFQLLYDL